MPPSAGWRKFEFKREKFKALLLYFSRRGLDEGLVIGSTKLNKLLFFADMRSFAELGKPITGARYQKLPFGPAARAMLPVRTELVDLKQAEFEERDPDDLNDVLVPLVEPDLGLFTDDEMRIANEVFEEMRRLNAKAISDFSHLKSAGWKVVAVQEDIPYESAFIVTDPPPAEAVDRGRELAAKYGW
jgi:uncharacterized phage-associated protein